MNTAETKKATILIVDDKPMNLTILINHLQESNYRIMAARSGEKAMEQLKYAHPDLILLDIMMPPGIDGFETCRRIKANESTKDIPIVFMSALTDTVDKVKGFKVGAVDYITKPFQQEEVLARVKTHLTIHKLRKKLEDQNEQLIRLNSSKDLFFSIIAHDLRGPFTGLLGISKILVKSINDLGPAERHELAVNFNLSIERTYKFLENLLDWAKLQRGEMKYQPASFSLNELIMSNIDLLTENAKQKGIKISYSTDSDIFVYADQNMIDTIIRNLVSNAIKFTKHGGGIDISATVNDIVEIAISDNGVGISDERMDKLFRIDIDRNIRTQGTSGELGTGLGLILCKELVKKNGGKIWASSEKGKGSTFKFILHQKPDPAC